MTEIRVPKLNSNDAEYVLLEWLADEGSQVRPGDPLVLLETSKAVEELTGEHEGLLQRFVPEGGSCTPGQLIGRVGEARETVAAETGDGPLITAPARALMEERGLDVAQVRALGLPLVRVGDVERLLSVRSQPPRLPSGQRAVAATVTRSWQTIPAAFTAIKVDAGPALARAQRLTKELRVLVGLPELVIQAVAGVHEDHPLFFAEWLDGDFVRYSEAPHVGLTIDVGKGLFVPVVRDAAALTLAQIASAVMGFRMTAMRGSFSPDELTGANILVALNDAMLAVPIIHPGQSCAVSLCAPEPELRLAEDGTVTQRMVVSLGLAYDHRLINGRDALVFLQLLRDVLEGDIA